MSGTAFTPGPWFVRVEDGNQFVCGGPFDDPIAHVLAQPADAHLSAAAPDLYEALGAALFEVEQYHSIAKPPVKGRVGRVAKEIRAALAKARGAG